MKKFIQCVFATSLITMSMSTCDTSNAVDVMFIVDSSGSVYDSQFNKWQSELDLVASIIQQLPDNARAGLINFAGCHTGSMDECIQEGRLKTMIELNQFEPSYIGTPIGRPPHLTALHSEVQSFGPDDFLGGYTWTNAALTIALHEFKSKPRPNHVIPNQVIVLITDGQPFPDVQANYPCDAETDYISDTLRELRDDLGVHIITVGIDISPQAKEEFFACMTEDMDRYFFDGLFNTLPSFADPISGLICDEAQFDIECEDTRNMVYTECGSCDQTCENPNPICMAVCQKKCECQSPNSIYDQGTCISVSQC